MSDKPQTAPDLDIIACEERTMLSEQIYYIRIPCKDQDELYRVQAQLVEWRDERV